METQVQVYEEGKNLPQRRSLFNGGPADTVAYATEVAKVLNDVIDQQKLFNIINGRKYVKVDGWITMGTLLGILPVEEWVKECEDGSFEASVKLVRQTDGMVIGSASALCGSDESTWRSRSRFARRSMAITRATGKAYRLGFSWVMNLAGYEPTPSEEMPEEKSASPVYEEHIEPPKPVENELYNEALYTATAQQKRELAKHCKAQGITSKEDMAKVSAACVEHNVAMENLKAAVKEWNELRPVIKSEELPHVTQ